MHGLKLSIGRSLFAAVACSSALLGGCATLPGPPAHELAQDDCRRWIAQLDAAVDAAGVRDAQDERIGGLPFLRVDRTAVASKDSVPLPQWLQRAAALDEQAGDAEIANLPAGAFPIDGAGSAASARARSQACRGAMTERVLQDTALQRTVRERAVVPDRYSSALRALGAYPLLRWPFFAGVQQWQQQHQADLRRWSARPPPRLRFEPPADDPLAPVFEIETRADGSLPPFDRFGVPAWSAAAAAPPSVDTAQPVVYRRDGMTLFGGQWLRQRSYTLWFAERPATGRFDLLAGPLDGVIVRLTLAADDRVLMLDTIHACGCYHAFYPAPGIEPRAGAPRHEEWAFVPAPLPPLRRGERPAVQIASRTHYVTGVAAASAPAPPSSAAYVLRDEQALRTLPLPGGGTRSLYGPDGLVRGSERGERFFFWPMGIASAGAMRQWGHHATAFVGRRHFDDPNLLESRFVLPAALLPPP